MVMTIRSFFRAAKVETAQPPYDTIHMKIFYPGQIPEEDQELSQQLLPVDTEYAPFPVVIFFSGFDCHSQMYQWLAVELIERGIVVVTFSWIEEYLPGRVSSTPGFNLSMLKPDTYGTAPSSTLLPTLLAELEILNSDGILAGMLDLQKIILGGHSAGGRMAMENANPQFFPKVAAAFSYGAHSAAPVMLGFEPGKILPLPDALPLLLMGGTRDGTIAKMSAVYGISGDATTSVKRTFQESIIGGRNDSYLLLWEGANHFSISSPPDPTTAIPFLDLPATEPEEEIRPLMAEIIGLFIDSHVRQQPTAFDTLSQLLNHTNPLIKSFERK
ncbi:MAG: dienelactone hydrolase [Microcoleaceae cyanobacterium]